MKIEREGNVTLSYPLLTKNNYSVWALKIRVNLQTQRVWEVMMLDEVDAHKDRMALATIYQALPYNILLMVDENDSSKLVWEMLKTMHVGVEIVKEAKLQTLKTHFKKICVKNGELVGDFTMKLTSIMTGIHLLGGKVGEISAVKNDNVFPEDDKANLTSFYDKDLSLMFPEGVTNYFPKDDETKFEEFVQESSKEESYVMLLNKEKVMANLLASGDEYNYNDVWYLDSGANNHMTSHRVKFNEIDEKITRNVKFKDGSKTQVY
ncbi:uncharacterized protein LOC124940210 [Impatiens glandulifera]|uniref:uncharacterized protein LOC124940210 n=1 Tax=Impatiens glandulifera TaxID=253017 RepID=UPI001FB0EAB0|nr:uncharacterized protein LOC124940210 [Impatiens glandulifera]